MIWSIKKNFQRYSTLLKFNYEQSLSFSLDLFVFQKATQNEKMLHVYQSLL